MNNLDKTVINLKVSKSLKREAQELADEIGVPLTTVMTASLKEFVRSRSLVMSALPRLKPAIEREIGMALEDYKKGKNISAKLTSAEEISTHLLSL
jgi:antitoxin component of RelBE/YafQ-DinJ toxin-antitoxin module